MHICAEHCCVDALRLVQVVDELNGNPAVLRKLKDFEYKDANGKDWGLNVRHRAKELAALVSDSDKLRMERAKVILGLQLPRICCTCGEHAELCLHAAGVNTNMDACLHAPHMDTPKKHRV